VFTKRVAVEISRPPDEVFAFVADARNRPSWDESVDSEELISPEPIGVGSTVRTRLRSMGRAYVLTWEIGGTFVQFAVTGRPTGMLRLLQPLIARNTQRNLDRGFPRLKQILETGAHS
jgi:Polyketide cyclase / dehydrase and lipid transport